MKGGVVMGGRRRVRTCASAAAEQEQPEEEEETVIACDSTGLIGAIWRHGFWRGVEYQLELFILCLLVTQSVLRERETEMRSTGKEFVMWLWMWGDEGTKLQKQAKTKAELLLHQYVRKTLLPPQVSFSFFSPPLLFTASPQATRVPPGAWRFACTVTRLVLSGCLWGCVYAYGQEKDGANRPITWPTVQLFKLTTLFTTLVDTFKVRTLILHSYSTPTLGNAAEGVVLRWSAPQPEGPHVDGVPPGYPDTLRVLSSPRPLSARSRVGLSLRPRPFPARCDSRGAHYAGETTRWRPMRHTRCFALQVHERRQRNIHHRVEVPSGLLVFETRGVWTFECDCECPQVWVGPKEPR